MVKVTLIPPRPVVQDVQLTMSMDVAEVLYAVLRRVGGEPLGLRGKADQIHNLLRQAGVAKCYSDVITGSIRLPDAGMEGK